MFLTINGKVVDDAGAANRILQPDFLLQEGLFETLRIYDGKAFRLDDHLARLMSSAQKLGIDPVDDFASTVVREVARAAHSGLTNAFLRIILVPGTSSTLIDDLPHSESRWYAEGISAEIPETRRNEFSNDSGIKTTKSLHRIREYRSKGKSAADDLIFLDTSGHLSEATASNVFFVAEGTVYTPPLTCGALPGITRKVVLEILDRVGIAAVSTRPLYLAEMQEASEVFLTSSIREIVPATLLGGQPVGTGKPGLITRGIMNNYARATRCSS